MNFITIIFSLVIILKAVFASTRGGDKERIFESIVEAKINDLRNTLKKYDNFHIDHQELELFDHHFHINDLLFGGFSNFTANDISLGGFWTWTLKLEIDVPRIFGYVKNWSINGTIINGEGYGCLKISDFKILVEGSYSLTGGLKSLHLATNVKYAKVTIDGVLNVSEILEVLEKSINYFLNTIMNHPTFHDQLSKICFGIAKNIMKNTFSS